MSITTYAELQTAIASWLGRTDLTATIPDLITIFEAAACRRLRVRPAESVTTLTPSSGVATLPTDYLGHRRVTWTGSPFVDLEYVHPSYFKSLYPTAPSGTPSVFTISAGSIYVMPTSDTDLSLDYYAKTAAVSGTLNWLFTKHPDAYLFGSLCEAGAYTEDPEKAVLWKARRDEVFDEIEKLHFREGAGLTMRVMGATP